jgi:tRNA dimethylallyltransferase
METASQRPKLLVIVGPTASGKSELALKIAKEFNSEIIAADSRTIYKGMDIGTAKPSIEERDQIRHWGLDLIEPGEPFSAYKYKEYAENAISDIQKRGKLPILVGGTGLYIDSVLFDFGFVPEVDLKGRDTLEQLSTEKLQEIIQGRNYPMPRNSQNRRHLISTIERKGKLGTRKGFRQEVAIIGLLPSDKVLGSRINYRIDRWFDTGLLKEVEGLLDKYGYKWLASGGIGYKAVVEHLEGHLSLEEAKSMFKKEHWQYARRQKTWFRRNKYIQWFDTPEPAFTSVSQLLNK